MRVNKGLRAYHGLLFALGFCLTSACGSDEDDEGVDEDAERYGCVYETRLIDSCNNPGGSPWVEGCVDVLTDDDCTLATEEMNEEVGDCTFTTVFRNVRTTPGLACPDMEGVETGPEEIEPAEAGEACTSLADCASGLCVPRFYCTNACSDASTCETDFPGGCCIGEGSLGYCLAQEDCSMLCPENSTPTGLPTVCVCDDGYTYDPMMDACTLV